MAELAAIPSTHTRQCTTVKSRLLLERTLQRSKNALPKTSELQVRNSSSTSKQPRTESPRRSAHRRSSRHTSRCLDTMKRMSSKSSMLIQQHRPQPLHLLPSASSSDTNAMASPKTRSHPQPSARQPGPWNPICRVSMLEHFQLSRLAVSSSTRLGACCHSKQLSATECHPTSRVNLERTRPLELPKSQLAPLDKSRSRQVRTG